jgi:hypothetical protein
LSLLGSGHTAGRDGLLRYLSGVSGNVGVLVHLAVEKPMTAHALSFLRRMPPMVPAARHQER